MGEEINLTKQAIDELLKDMNAYKEYNNNNGTGTNNNLRERKINPLIKPNKRFLGRTLNSMLNHNRRESERTRKLCQRKLRQLDRKHRKREYQKTSTAAKKSKTKMTSSRNSLSPSSSSSYESYTSSRSSNTSSNCSVQKKYRKKYKKKCRKKLCKRRISISSDTSVSLSSGEETCNRNKPYEYRKNSLSKQEQRSPQGNEEVKEENNEEVVDDEFGEEAADYLRQWHDNYYDNCSMQTINALYYSHHMNRLWWAKQHYHHHQQQQEQQQHQEQSQLPLTDTVDINDGSSDSLISSDFTFKSTSNISLSSSCDEENDKKSKEILTFEVPSSDSNDNNVAIAKVIKNSSQQMSDTNRSDNDAKSMKNTRREKNETIDNSDEDEMYMLKNGKHEKRRSDEDDDDDDVDSIHTHISVISNASRGEENLESSVVLILTTDSESEATTAAAEKTKASLPAKKSIVDLTED